MMKQDRPPAPDVLRRHYKEWGKAFAKKRKEYPGFRFQWKSYQGKRVNERLKPELIQMTANHCSFCDSYPLGTSADQTIEHFRPKSKYPLLVYVWHNLFLSCNICQKAKGEKFDKKLLKPDQPDYEFERYFMLNYKTGQIEVNPSASVSDQERAEITIEMYGLNRNGRPHSRLREYGMYGKLSREDFPLDDFSYRFFLK